MFLGRERVNLARAGTDHDGAKVVLGETAQVFAEASEIEPEAIVERRARKGDDATELGTKLSGRERHGRA
jgi:hypothetical protein